MTRRRLLIDIVLGLVVFAALLLIGYHTALEAMQDRIQSALGLHGEIGALKVGLRRIDIDGLRIRASLPGWPGKNELLARRVAMTPDLRSLLGGDIVIAKIEVEGAELTLLRDHKGLRILPSLLDHKLDDTGKSDKPGDKAKAAGIAVRIRSINLRDASIDLHDNTLAKPQHIHLDQFDARIDELNLPALDSRSTLSVHGRIEKRGSLSLQGWLVAGSKDANLQLKLDDVALKLVEPYLFRQQLGEVKSGRVALNLSARVEHHRLKAPGHLKLSDIQLGGFAGFSREAAAAFARARGLDADTKRPVDMDFTLEGNLDDGRFSLNDAIYRQTGMATLKLIGLGSSSESHSSQGSGLGERIRNLFSNQVLAAGSPPLPASRRR